MSPIQALAEVVGDAACLTQEADLAPYAVDWRGAYRAVPAAVVKPATTD